jgi:outer membrane murein-binding lipoprotein Lpp
MDLSTQNTTFGLGEDEVDSQPTYEMPTDLDIWVDSVGRKKGRIFGLGSYSKTLIPSSNQQTNTHANSEEVEFLRSQVHALNASLQRQEQEKLQMRQQMQRQEKEMSKTNKKLAVIMQHLGFVGSSSHVSNPNSESNEHIDEDDNANFVEDDFVDEDNNSYHIDN